MTFGSTFGRVFSPTFQPKSQAAASAASTWWDLNGTITSCVAAWQGSFKSRYVSPSRYIFRIVSYRKG